jgi:mannose-6-phosphate isomerase-like protein (cupin superfamily)
MRTVFLALALCVTAADLGAQRRGAGGGSATLAIVVSDPAGAPLSNVLVTLEGPATRSVRTEGGRIALENLPAGNYRLRFEHEGFLTLERELTARGGAPIDVKVTLKPEPAPPAPPPAPVAPPPPPPPAVDAKLVVFDMPALIEKEFVGRASGRTTPLACGAASASSMIQVKQPVAEHAHTADEIIYVIAGEGSAQASGRDEKLQAGVFLFIPKGMPHGFKQSGRNPLIVLSTRAGESCGGSQ